MKKIMALALGAILTLSMFTGCGQKANENDADGGNDKPVEQKSEFDTSKEIGVVSRESGSGTRGAFIELFGIEEKNAAGEKVDNTIQTAVTTNSTSVMMTTVAGDKYAIGYISLGSLNDTVKALKIDGVSPSVAAIKDGSYKVSRPFNIVTKDGLSDAAQDFISYILSKDGQKVIEDKGYIPASDAPEYESAVKSGTVKVEGSSSVTPVMEKLSEEYAKVNPGVTVEIQQDDSSTGISAAADGSCDIGMASRELKDSEAAKGVTATVIAIDGIAVIANNACTVEGLTSEQVKAIYTGNAVVWSDVAGK